MILLRFAIVLFGLALIGMAFSLTSAHSQDNNSGPSVVAVIR
jgi:hypothetical protein